MNGDPPSCISHVLIRRGNSEPMALMDSRNNTHRHRLLLAATLFCTTFAQPYIAPASASEARPHTSALTTSRWWKLACDEADRSNEARRPACVLTVQLRGTIDHSRLVLLEHALARRDAVRRALGRDITIHVDVDSAGGEVFAALEIGRLLRRDQASISVGHGSSCISACVLVLMGATARSIAADARVGIHRPSLGKSGTHDLVDAMSEPIAVYAQQTTGSRKIVDAMMSIPSRRVRFLTPADLAAYGIAATEKR